MSNKFVLFNSQAEVRDYIRFHYDFHGEYVLVDDKYPCVGIVIRKESGENFPEMFILSSIPVSNLPRPAPMTSGDTPPWAMADTAQQATSSFTSEDEIKSLLSDIRKEFESALSLKTGWGRNEIREKFNLAIETAIKNMER